MCIYLFSVCIVFLNNKLFALCRSKNDIKKRKWSNLDEFRDDDHDGNVTVTSGSYSWDEEEKAYGDIQISSMGQGNEFQRRYLSLLHLILGGFSEGCFRYLVVMLWRLLDKKKIDHFYLSKIFFDY